MRYMDTHCKYTEEFNPEHTYIFTGRCVVTRETVSVKVPARELFAYRQGALIQVAMPSVSVEDREFLLSGISAKGWRLRMNTSTTRRKE